jgi:hypothetical protein
VILLEIRNENDLLNAFNPILDEVVAKMADEILDIIYGFIEADVYDKYEAYVYKRTEEFLNSWISEIDRTGRRKEVIARIFDSPKKMSLDINHYVHGSPESNDFRAHLAEAIEEGLGGHYWFPKYRRDGSINPAYVKRPFFTDTIKYLEKNGRLFQMFEKEMAKHGLYIQKGKTLHWDYTVGMRLLNYGLDE